MRLKVVKKGNGGFEVNPEPSEESSVVGEVTRVHLVIGRVFKVELGVDLDRLEPGQTVTVEVN